MKYMMNMPLNKTFIVAVLFTSLSLNRAYAGSGCENQTLEASEFQKAMTTAQKNYEKLDELNPQVAIIARVGSDLSEYGLKYSHLGFIWRDAQMNNQWRVVHLLNACGSDSSSLWREGLGNFFMDKPFSYNSQIMIPSVTTQKRLATILQSNDKIYHLHNPHYSMVAYAFGGKYQNSNQWVLETMTKAMVNETVEGKKITTRAQAQNWLKAKNYQPSTLNISALKRLGAKLTKANIAFDDHPDELRYLGKINAVTVDSVKKFLIEQEPEIQIYELK